MIDSINRTAVLPAGDGGHSSKKTGIESAAKQFESLLLAQILRTAREAGSSEGWLGSGQDSSAATAIEMAEEHFAAALSAQGGMGLAKLITAAVAAPETRSPSRDGSPL